MALEVGVTVARVELEVCVDSIQSAINAAEAGADRLELCANLLEGGVTPSYGLIKTIIGSASIPVHVLIRPRGGDFCYSPAEVQCMFEDIEVCKALGARAVVLGALTHNGDVDEELLKLFVEKASPMLVTFHRAIDMSRDLLRSLEIVIRCGVCYVLTSGGAATAAAGADTLKQFVAVVQDKCTIIAAGGITPQNAAQILKSTGVTNIHASARSVIDSCMMFRKADVFMGGEKTNTATTEYSLKVADPELVRRLKTICATAP